MHLIFTSMFWSPLSLQSRSTAHFSCLHLYSYFCGCGVQCCCFSQSIFCDRMGNSFYINDLIIFVLATFSLICCPYDINNVNLQERSVLLTGILYLGPFFVTVSFLNTVAISYGATAAIPFGTILVILLIYAFLAIPLLGLGGLIGYCIRSEFQAPCATKQYPREIPSLAWYRRTPFQMFVGGLLPFSAIALQLHHLYASMWGYKIYTLPGILFVTFIILIILTAILTIGLTYIQLSVEDHEWWWRYVLFCMPLNRHIEHGCCVHFHVSMPLTFYMFFTFYYLPFVFKLILKSITSCIWCLIIYVEM